MRPFLTFYNSALVKNSVRAKLKITIKICNSKFTNEPLIRNTILNLTFYGKKAKKIDRKFGCTRLAEGVKPSEKGEEKGRSGIGKKLKTGAVRGRKNRKTVQPKAVEKGVKKHSAKRQKMWRKSSPETGGSGGKNLPFRGRAAGRRRRFDRAKKRQKR